MRYQFTMTGTDYELDDVYHLLHPDSDHVFAGELLWERLTDAHESGIAWDDHLALIDVANRYAREEQLELVFASVNVIELDPGACYGTFTVFMWYDRD